MSSKTAKAVLHSAAWRISLWATLAFACGTMLVFVFLHRFVASDIQRRSDAWLSGEVEVLGDVAEQTPKNALHDRVVEEVAELASKEVPNRDSSASTANDSVFFLQTGGDGSLSYGLAREAAENLKAIQASGILQDHPTDLRVSGFSIPFRVASTRIDDGSFIYLGLSERDELRVLGKLRVRFIPVVAVASAFWIWHCLLYHPTYAQSCARDYRSSFEDRSFRSKRAGANEARHDEVGNLALTLNHMLDRIESSMHQLHTITDSLAHDLRSPLTAIRGKLEMSLSVQVTRQNRSYRSSRSLTG